MPKYKLSDLGFKEKLFLYKAHLWHSLIMQDFVSSYKYSQKWVDLFENNREMKMQNPVFYLKGVNYLLEALYLIQHNKKFGRVLERLKVDLEEENVRLNDNTKTLSFLYYNQNKLNQFFLEGNFNNGLPYIENLLLEINENADKIDAHHIMVFYYKIACMYFGAGKNEKCIYYLEKIILNYSRKWLKADQVTKFKDRNNVIYLLYHSKLKNIYVGKANNLGSRVKAGQGRVGLKSDWDKFMWFELNPDYNMFLEELEHFLIKTFASILENNLDIEAIIDSKVTLVNRQLKR